jgi:hypothetical protein
MRHSRYSLFILLVIWCAFERNAYACTCMRSSPCQALGQASAVFVGSVLSVSSLKAENRLAQSSFGRVLIRLSIHQAFFGVKGQEVEVATGMGGGDCGYVFERGASYLVYAHRESEKGKLSTSICTRTRPLGDAGEDLAYLREAIKDKPGVMIYGEVRRYHPKGGEPSSLPLANLTVTIKGKNGERRVTTGEDGKYQVSDLQAGKYEVMIDLADGLWTRTPQQELVVGERGCAKIDYLVETDGRIVGKVVDEHGQGLSKVHLVALKVDPADPQKAVNQEYAMTEEGGQFLFRGLSAGRYLFKITHARSQLYPASYYPGVQTTADAYAVNVGEGQKVEGIELRLRPAAREYLLQGVVVWPDGRPAADFDVAWGIPNENYRMMTKTDQLGRFTVRLFAGYKFWINASMQDASGAWSVSDEMPPFEPTDGMEPLRLTLRPPKR